MPSLDRSLLRSAELILAGLVLAVAVVTLTALPEPYPTWPTVGAVPVNPELVVPGLLGVAALAGAFADGLGVGPVVIGALTAYNATASLYTLYAVESGGVFWGGFFTLLAGVPLAVAVLARAAVRRLDPDWLPDPTADP